MKQIIIKGKVFKVGNSYGVRVKKALVESQIMTEGEEVTLILTDNRKSSGKGQDSDQNSPVVLRTLPHNIQEFLGNTYKDYSLRSSYAET